MVFFGTLTQKERCTIENFNSQHSHDTNGQFIFPLPKHFLDVKLEESLPKSPEKKESIRQEKSRFSYNKHPIILHSKHPLCKLLILYEHVRLPHGGSLLVSASLFRTYHIISRHQAIHSIDHSK